jgi:release factor glutamine methyltransferase
VREHDPRRALDGGADGLDAYRAIAADARRLLRPAGHLVVEIGAGQRFQVARIFESAGLATVTVRSDLSDIERAVAFRPG